MKPRLLLALISSLLVVSSALAAGPKEVLVEFNGEWYPASVEEEGESLGVKTYRVKYQSSGGLEWVAPNRVLLDKSAAKGVVGESKDAPEVGAGKDVSIEYNGGWYPGKVLETGSLFGTTIYKVSYAQSGLQEWIAPNRIKLN